MSNPEPAAARRLFGVAPQVLLLGIASLLNDVSSEMIYPLLPIFLATQTGAGPFVIGMIEGTAEALAAFLKLAAGWLSDRTKRRKPFITVGYALAALSRAMISVAGRWPTVLAARLLDRTGKGLRSAPRDALIGDVTPQAERGRAFGFHRSMDHLGALIGPLAATALLMFWAVQLRTLFLVAVIPAAIGVLMLVLFLREPPRETAASGSESADIPREPLPRPFWGAITSVAIFYLANSSDVFLILRAYDVGVDAAWIPMLWAGNHVIKSAFSGRAGALSDRVGRGVLLVAGWLSYAVIYLVFPFAGSLWMFVVLFVLYAIPFTLSEGPERAWVTDTVPGRVRGKAFGIYYLAVGTFTLAGTALFGWLYQEVSPRAAFHTGAAIAVVAAISVWMQRKRPEAGTARP